MAEDTVIYIWTPKEDVYQTSYEVILAAPALGWNDGGQIIAEDSAFALKMLGDKNTAWVTVGGNYSDYNLYAEKNYTYYSSEPSFFTEKTAAVTYANGGSIIFESQAGAGTAGLVDGQQTATTNYDESIKIRAEESVSVKTSASVQDYSVGSNYHVYAIDSDDFLNVASSVAGTIESVLTTDIQGYKTIDAVYHSFASDHETATAAFQSVGALTVSGNYQAVINSTNQSEITTKTETNASKVSSNNASSFGVKAASINVSGLWQGEVNVTNKSAMTAPKDSSSTVTVSGNTIASYGLQTTGDFVVESIEDSTWYIKNQNCKISGEVGNIDEKTTSTLTVSDNKIAASAIDVENFTVNGTIRDTQMTVDVCNNKISGTCDSSANLITFTGNSFEVIGIKAETVQWGDVDSSFSLNVLANNNTCNFSKGSLQSGSGNTVSVAGIDAGTLTARSLNAEISVSVSGSYIQDTTYDIAAINAGSMTVSGLFGTDITLDSNRPSSTAISVSGRITADSFSGSINENSGSCVTGISAGSLASSVSGDDFDMSGVITNVSYGISCSSALNLRVSGTINAEKMAIVAGSLKDFVRIASTANIVGDIDLGINDNKILIDSNADIQGNLLAKDGQMSVYFELNGEAQADAIITTDDDDVTLLSTTYLAVNLNGAANDDTYKLLQYDENEVDKWKNRDVTFVYNGISVMVRTDSNGKYEGNPFGDSEDEHVVFQYDESDNSITVSVTGIEAPDAFDDSNSTATYDDAASTMTIDWSNCTVPETRMVELEYQVFDADNNPYGESVVVICSNNETNYVLNGISAGESVKWRLRSTSTIYHTSVSGWGDWKTSDPIGEPETVYPSLEDCTPVARKPGHTSQTASSVRTSTALLSWNEATSDVPIDHYTVEYIVVREPYYSEEDIEAAFDSTDPSQKKTVYSKTVSSCEALVSGLTEGDYVYWRMKATDCDGEESEVCVYGNSFQVSRYDVDGPTLQDYSGTVVYTPYPDRSGCDISAVVTWDPATDEAEGYVPSGVSYYTLEYAVKDSGDWIKVGTYYHVPGKEEYSDTIYNLSKDEDYQYRITAYDFAGNSTSSKIDRCILPKDSTAPVQGACSGEIRYTYDGGFGIHADITWEAATDTQSGVNYYTVEYAVKGTENWVLAEQIPHESSLTSYSVSIDGLDNEDYSYRITAYDYVDNSSVETRTDELPKDSVAPTLGVYSGLIQYQGVESGTYAVITWDPASDDKSGVSYYTVEYAVKGTENWVLVDQVTHDPTQTSAYSIQIDGLSKDEYYNYRITAVDYVENSETKTGEILRDDTAPTLGNSYSQIWYSYVGGFGIHADIMWDPAVDEQSGVSYYTVEYAVNGTEDWVMAGQVTHNQTQTSAYYFRIDGLSNEDYQYRITAYDYAGNSSVTVKTDGLPKDSTAPELAESGVTTKCKYYRSGAEYYLALTASWDPGTDVGSGIEEYEFTYWDADSPTATKTITVKASDVTSTGKYVAEALLPYKGAVYDYQFTAVDYCGNVSTELTGSFGGGDVVPPVGTFTSFNEPVVSVTYEEDASTIKDATVTFSWNDTYTDTLSPVCYKLQFSNTAEFNEGSTYTFYNTPADGKTFTLSNNVVTMSVGVLSKLALSSYIGIVYWRVMAMDNPGNDAQYALVTEGNETGVWSETQTLAYVDKEGYVIASAESPAAATNISVSNSYSDYCYTVGTTVKSSIEHTRVGVQDIVYTFSNTSTGETTTIEQSYGSVVDSGTSSSTSVSASSDLADGMYWLNVQTRDALGYYSNSVGLFVVDTTRPDTVTGVQISQSGQDITVSWNPSHDEFGIAGYQVAYRYKTTDGSANWNYSNMTSDTSTTIYGMNDGEYEFVVYAYDTAYSDMHKAYSNRSLASATVVYSTTQKKNSDLNRDGRSDVLLTNKDGFVVSWLIQKDQTPNWNYLCSIASGYEVFDTGYTTAGKSTSDVYLYNRYHNELVAWNTDNSGNVTGWESIGSYNSDMTVLGVGDFNGDGQSDVLLRSSSGAVGYDFTSGETTGWKEIATLNSSEWDICAICDLNGDGMDDLLIQHVSGFADSLLTQADGSVAWVDMYTIPDGSVIAGCGDFNGDGTDDVLLKTNDYYGALLVHNGGAYAWMGLGELSNMSLEQIDDFNGDGVDDLRVRYGESVIGVELVMGADTLLWNQYAAIGNEWTTTLASI